MRFHQTKYWCAGLLIVALPVAGCSSAADPKPGDSAASAQATAGVIKDSGEQPLIRVFVSSNRKYPDGLSSNNNPFVEFMSKENNVKLDWTLGPGTRDEYIQKANLLMAGNDIPDLIYWPSADDLSYYAKQGALQPLDDLLEKHAPTVAKILKESKDVTASATFGGKLYGIPFTLDYKEMSRIMYIRKDWLDKLKLPVPKTIEDTVAVMKAFVQAKQDGQNTVGFTSMPLDGGLGLDALIGAFGTMNEKWLERNGQLVYGSIQPEMKEALAFLRSLQEQKLLDPEWFVQKRPQFEEKIVSGKVGIYTGEWSDQVNLIANTLKNNPGSEWVDIDLPVGPSGKQGSAGTFGANGYFSITAQSKHVVQILQIYEWYLQDSVFKTFNRGFEGKHWQIKDGKYAANADLQGVDLYRRDFMLMYPPTGDRDFTGNRHPNLLPRFDKGQEQAKYVDKYLGPTTPTMLKSKFELQKLERSVFTEIINGNKPLDEFDKFAADWKSKGGEQITKEVNEWFGAR